MIKFYTAKNYKSGKFILSKYKQSDFYIIAGSIAIGIVLLFVEFFSDNPSLLIMAVIMAIALSPLVLFTPSGKYFNLFTYIQTVISYQMRPKHYRWGGIIYEEIKNRDIYQEEKEEN